MPGRYDHVGFAFADASYLFETPRLGVEYLYRVSSECIDDHGCGLGTDTGNSGNKVFFYSVSSFRHHGTECFDPELSAEFFVIGKIPLHIEDVSEVDTGDFSAYGVAFSAVGVDRNNSKACDGVFIPYVYDLTAQAGKLLLLSILHGGQLFAQIVDEHLEVADKARIAGDFRTVAGQEVDDFTSPGSEAQSALRARSERDGCLHQGRDRSHLLK